MDEFEILETIDCRGGDLHYPSMSIKSMDSKDDPGRFFKGVLNANTIDRDGERFEPKGVDLRGFKAAGGPVVNRHFGEVTSDGFSNVVGRVLSVVKSDQGVIIKKAEFDTDPISDHWRGKVHRGFVKGLSAGLLRKKAELRQSKRDGKQHVVVTDSELIHVALTSQPVNRDSLIAAKSIDRIAAMELRLKNIGSDGFVQELSQKISEGFMGQLSQEIADLSEQVANLSSGHRGKDGRDCTTVSGLNEIAESLATLCVGSIKSSHSELPDAAFIIEKGAEYNSDGSVVREFRHLPHHTGNVENPVSNTAVNKALLRNALARVNQVKPTKESAESFKARAERHLRRHANALGIGSGN